MKKRPAGARLSGMDCLASFYGTNDATANTLSFNEFQNIAQCAARQFPPPGGNSCRVGHCWVGGPARKGGSGGILCRHRDSSMEEHTDKSLPLNALQVGNGICFECGVNPCALACAFRFRAVSRMTTCPVHPAY